MRKGLIAAVCVGLLASACSGASESVVERVASPDGRYEAVLMVCQTPSDFTASDLLVMVYDEKGRGCEKAFVDAVAGVTLTHPDKDGVNASIRWDEDVVVLTSATERQLMSGLSRADGPRMIRLDGPVTGAEGWTVDAPKAERTPQPDVG